MTQLSLLDDSWVRRDELDALGNIIKNAYGYTGHMKEPEYDYPTRWPRLVEHCYHGVCAVFMQRREGAPRVRPVDGRVVRTEFRVVFVDAGGYVVDESEWCTTEGGCRGYVNRARAEGQTG